jgi:peptide/nickel transport system substrate-binding protein
VAFTFNEIKQYPAADIQGVWTYLTSVVAPNDTTVVMTLKKPYVPALYTIADATFIIPQHIFASVGDPTKYVSDKPVGTGPFVIGRYTPDVVAFDRNPNYWQANKVKVNEIRMPYTKGNQAAELQLAKGELDWAGFFSPDLQNNFVAKDPAHNHYWMAPIDEFGLFPNLTNPLLADVAVRQAINAALDRQAIVQQAEAGLTVPINATALVLPGAKPYLDPSYANLSNSPNVQQADKYLTDAGFVKGSDGIFMDKSGHRLSFTLRSVIGYTDWNQMAQIMQQDLRAAGIEISKVNQVDPNQYYGIRGDTNFDLEIGGLAAGPTPFYIYNSALNSKFIGTNSGNYERWNNPQTDQLLSQYAQTNDPATQKQIIANIEKMFVQQLPYIPIAAGPRWFEYSTLHYTGWPTQDNAYATGSPYSAPDNEIVVMHLTPAS